MAPPQFALSFRDVELLLAKRGVEVSYETVRRWCRKLAQTFANLIRRQRPRPCDRWHLDEVFLKINGVQHYLWRAVEQEGMVLDILVQSRRNTKAAKHFFTKLLKGLRYVPRVVVTDKLQSYAAAKSKIIASVEHRQSRHLNNQAKQLLSAHGPIHQHGHPHRHRMSAAEYRADRTQAFEVWKQETHIRTVA